MCQVNTEHVEADAAFGVSAFSYKKEAATPVHKPFDEPDASQTIDVQMLARHPTPPLILREVHITGGGLRVSGSFPPMSLGMMHHFAAALIS